MFDNNWGNYDEEPEDQDPLEGLPEKMTDEEWARTPKRWSTMVMLTMLNAIKDDTQAHSEAELIQAAISLLQQDKFSCSWSEKYGEIIFWPSSIPLNEVKREVI